jgi:hypothetical protein
MTQINTNLLNPRKILHDHLLEEYVAAKEAMNGVPTSEKLKNLIVVTAKLSIIRKEMENEFPEA